MRRSILRPWTIARMRPSCGRRRSAMSRLAMIFRREMMAGVHRVRRVHRLEEDAVDAVADLERLFLGLDVDVAGALLDRVEDQVVDEADDRATRCRSWPGR